MILVAAGTEDAKTFDAKVLFASQLSARRYSIVIDEGTIPDTIDRSQKYDAAPFLTDISACQISGLILIGADEISNETLMKIRSYTIDPTATVCAIGRFPDYQSYVSASSKIAFVLGREATVINLNELQKQQLLKKSISPLTGDGSQRKKWLEAPQLFVFLPEEILEDPQTIPVLSAISHLNEFSLNVVSTGAGKSQILQTKYSNYWVYGLTELSPAAFAQKADIAAFFGERVPGERMANFSLNLMRSSGILIDCTTTGAFVSCGAPALRGSGDLAALPNYLINSVMPNRQELGRQASLSPWLESNSIEHLENALGLPQPATKLAAASQSPPKTVFVPTNGAGMGHAQRCSLIAAASGKQEQSSFAAFPKCIPLLNSKGYSCMPLVQKSEYHTDAYANDIVNYLRYRRTFSNGDRLVFDGGYVFDSVYRTIIEKSLSATWIRRGLWQAGQIRESAFEREKAFSQVIVPGEIFEELNVNYTIGNNVHQVGPIVQISNRTSSDILDIRTKLMSHLNHEFDELVVTMLGAGVSADRNAQTMAMCVQLERRSKCLHLVVNWPGSQISTSLNGWNNTRVVTTVDALALCQAANLVVSATGYNSFHEIMYHEIPAIFVPQTAAHLDDQEKRARAASARGLAETVMPNELLLLEQQVGRFLDGERAAEVVENFRTISAPEIGNSQAAELIFGGVAHG